MSSLEELLAEDGFKRGRDKMNLKREGSIAANFPNPRPGFSGSKTPPSRTRSDVNPRRSLLMLPEKGGFTESRPGNALARRFSTVQFYKKQSTEVQETGSRFFGYSKERKESEGSSGKKWWRLFSIQEARRAIGSKDGCSEDLLRKLGYSRSYKNELYDDEERKGKRTQNLKFKPSFKDVSDKWPAHALDETTLKAVFSIINSCVSDLLDDESFRSSVNQSCISSLNSSEVKDTQPSDNGVLSTLKEAIGSAERIIVEGYTDLELKKTSLKLSVFTGLKSMKSDYRDFSGISLSHLAACAHLYLSILYKIQKKDKISVKHLLQVFYHSPCQARTTLLPELWESIFLPHLSHLKAWHEREVESIQGTSGMKRKLEFLKKIYNDLLDMGTSKFAAFYKGCLMEDNNGPALPSILIPFVSFPEIPEDDYEIVSTESSSSSNSVPKAMISKRLYEFNLAQAKRIQTADGMESGLEEKDEMGDEIEESQSDVWRQYHATIQKDEETENQSSYLGSYSTESIQEYYTTGSQDLDASFEDEETGNQSSYLGSYSTESIQEYYTVGSQGLDASFEIMQENDQKNENSCGSSSSSLPETEEINRSSEMLPSWHDVKEHIHVNKCDLQDNENELKMKKLPQAAFELQVTDHYKDTNTNSPKQSIILPVYSSYQDKMTDVTRTKFVMEETDAANRFSSLSSLKEKFSADLLEYQEDIHEGSLFSGVPKDFICPLTGLLLKDPVTLESGYTFELAAIKERFNRGNKTCPITGQSLKCSTIPDTNIVFKHKIIKWVAECFRNSLSLASQSSSSPVKQVRNSKYELVLLIIKQMLTAFSSEEEEKENIKHLISLGSLQLLTQIFELGSLENKSCAAGLLARCIQADGYCRNYLPMDIGKPSLLELFLSKQVHARTNAASLLIELICLNRRMDITSFVSGLRTDVIDNTKHELLVCLQNSQPEDRVLVAVLLLHLDLMEESRIFSVYKGEAVKCIIKALECCLSNRKFMANCERALLMLGGHFSFSREILTETWLLKQDEFDFYSSSFNEEGDQTITEEEARRRKDWLKNMALTLLGYGRKLFLERLSNCWQSGSPDLARVCLLTTAWLSDALASISVPSLRLSTFLALMPRLKESLNNDVDIEQRALASLCLLNFSKILECRISLITFADQICDSLKSLREVTWTAKQLYNDIFEETT